MLEKNELLEHITEKLAYAQPDWERIMGRLSQNYKYQGREPHVGNVVGEACEIHVRLALERICCEFSENVEFDPIKHQRYVGVDVLMAIDELPVVFEVKSTDQFYHEISRGKVEGLRKYISAHFGVMNYGYVLVAPRDAIIDNNPKQQEFRKNGGIMIPLYATREQFKADVMTHLEIVSKIKQM